MGVRFESDDPLLAPDGLFGRLMGKMRVLAIQSGEWGPLMQVAAGLDAAVHDLAARRARLPLWCFLGGSGDGAVAAYASGIGPETPAEAAAAARRDGHAAFKIKLGFGTETDRRSLTAMRETLGPEAKLLADSNQAWELETALTAVRGFAGFDLGWLEEPLRADRPLDEWRRLAEASPMPLAGGENIASDEGFRAALEAGVLRYVQPDLAKWGGVSGCLAVARLAALSGAVYCPHFLGGGIGLMTSAHVLAAAGGEGLLEIDVNPNPLRDDIVGKSLPLSDGRVRLPDAPGIGIEPDWPAL